MMMMMTLKKVSSSSSSSKLQGLKKSCSFEDDYQNGVNLAELLHCVYVSHMYSCTTGFSMARVTYALSSPKVYEKF